MSNTSPWKPCAFKTQRMCWNHEKKEQVNESLLQYRYPGYAFAIGEQKTVVFVYEMRKAVSSTIV